MKETEDNYFAQSRFFEVLTTANIIQKYSALGIGIALFLFIMEMTAGSLIIASKDESVFGGTLVIATSVIGFLVARNISSFNNLRHAVSSWSNTEEFGPLADLVHRAHLANNLFLTSVVTSVLVIIASFLLHQPEKLSLMEAYDVISENKSNALTKTSLELLNERGHPLVNVSAEDAWLNRIKLHQSTIYHSNFASATLTKAHFEESEIHNVNFASTNLVQADFSDATVRNSDFSGACLVGAQFEGATLENNKWTSAVLYKSQLDEILKNSKSAKRDGMCVLAEDKNFTKNQSCQNISSQCVEMSDQILR